MKKIILPLLIFCFYSVTAQKNNYPASSISDSLKKNANAVVRINEQIIDISSQRSMTVKTKVVTTVLNKLGLSELELTEYFNKNTRISKISATAYNSLGLEIKTYKRKDFKDVSVADGFSVFSDQRAFYLDYTPTDYPFTMVFETESETSNTAFIPSWSPVENYLVSTEFSTLTINYKPELKLRNKELNFSTSFPIQKKETASSISYTASNIYAKKKEELSPSSNEIFPYVLFSLENFNLENVDGKVSNWSEFGKWYYQSLLADTEEIPKETQEKIKSLVGNEKNPIEIAKIIYKYVQEKTRYVSIQVGIGGWKPMLAKEVDKFGYGDCKALSNYTRSLLKSVGVESYFTLVYAGHQAPRSLIKDFASIQGNHAILSIPVNNDLVWLECTSQIHPFGFQGNFTDDRNVLIIKPEGGEIVRTKTFTEKDNICTIKGSYTIMENGTLKGSIEKVSTNLEYDEEFQMERKSKEDQIKKLKEEFSTINNLKISKISLKNDSKNIQFTENIDLSAEEYAQLSGGKYMFALNAFDQINYVPKKYKTREFPFQIQRGFTNEDEIEINLPQGNTVEAKPNTLEIDNEFGYYKIETIILNPSKILYKRKYIMKKGFYDKTKYETYRKFIETIAKADNSKIIISKS